MLEIIEMIIFICIALLLRMSNCFPKSNMFVIKANQRTSVMLRFSCQSLSQ